VVRKHFSACNYRWTSLSAVFLSADSLIHECKISLKGQISSQNVSFYLRIQYSQSKIVGRIYVPRIMRLTCNSNIKNRASNIFYRAGAGGFKASQVTCFIKAAFKHVISEYIFRIGLHHTCFRGH